MLLNRNIWIDWWFLLHLLFYSQAHAGRSLVNTSNNNRQHTIYLKLPQTIYQRHYPLSTLNILSSIESLAQFSKSNLVKRTILLFISGL
ncbi:hypothetical protein FGO68_gene16790 [Halteria grandinella]|uniref:Secreted protein n=1 Tax=Halteria grandinella TaxID=5974 RepID=A0A8J8ND09_HALGN|nr:hypothetical protein FGO68_gene16790 [Halteria grandinella]